VSSTLLNVPLRTDISFSVQQAVPKPEPAQSVTDEEPDQIAEREAKISRMTYKEFRKIKPSMTQPKNVAAIVVCYEDADMHDIAKQSKQADSETSALRVPRQDAIPTHIAINSKTLAQVIKSEVEFDLEDEQKIFIASFKAIVTYESAIRKAFERRTIECESEKAVVDEKSIDPASVEDNRQNETQSSDADSSYSESRLRELYRTHTKSRIRPVR
jgi:hypothetical protein